MKITFSSRKGRASVRKTGDGSRPKSEISIEETLQKIKNGNPEARENYRERSLALHGLICAKCGREFEVHNRHLLTVHHKDGNHSNNPPDGSNWENLCIYCHEEEHSRGMLGDYFEDSASHPKSANREGRVVFSDDDIKGNTLAVQLQKAWEKSGKK